MNSLLYTVLLIVGGYAALCLFMYLGQSRLLFYPARDLAASPAAIGLAYEDVNIVARDGIVLHGWFLPGRPEAKTLLFLHGNAGNISHRLESLLIFNRLGLSVLIIDYRGYGRSQGSISEPGMDDDAEAAWDYLVGQRRVAAGEIVVFGRSLGASVAARLAAGRAPGGLILESAFTSVPDMAAELYPFLPARWLARYSFAAIEHLAAVSCPVLIVHSPADELVPFGHGQRLYDAASSPKEFLAISGSHNHGFLASGQRYTEGLGSFLATYMP